MTYYLTGTGPGTGAGTLMGGHDGDGERDGDGNRDGDGDRDRAGDEDVSFCQKHYLIPKKFSGFLSLEFKAMAWQCLFKENRDNVASRVLSPQLFLSLSQNAHM